MCAQLHCCLIRLDHQTDLIVNNSTENHNPAIQLLTGKIRNVAKFIHGVDIGFSHNHMEISNLLDTHKKLLCIRPITELGKTPQLLLHRLSLAHELINLCNKLLGSRL